MIRGPLFNEDDSNFFVTHHPDQISAEAIDVWVDALAEAGVGTLLTCPGAMTCNYATKVWETRWSRYDPAGPDDQPVLRYLEPAGRAGVRRWLESEKRLADLGVNFHQRAHRRCRERGMGAWLSVRMNDLHDCHLADSPLLSEFFKAQRPWPRVPYRAASWPDRALDWSRPVVREHYRRLIVELLDMLDLDGLELDWMRFGFHFPVGHELEGGAILTAWIEDIKALCTAAGQRLGHPVKLGVRVPSRPETARRLGLDGVAWAHAGLIDLLVPTPFWATCEFDLALGEWRRLLAGTAVVLAGGLEIRYQPMPGGPAHAMTPELAAGAATAVLSQGADAVYLFNYFLDAVWDRTKFKRLMGALSRLDTVAALPRRHAVTWRDVRAPGEPRETALPAEGRELEFRLVTGPRPAGRSVEVLLECAAAPAAPPAVRVNGTLCSPPATSSAVLVYGVPAEALTQQEHVIEVSSPAAIRLVRVELAVH